MIDSVSNAARDFHRVYYGDERDRAPCRVHARTFYHGIETHKCPLDLWIYQEILHELRPELVIELGTYRGGSTLFIAHQLELLNCGRIVSIDLEVLPRPEHPRISYLTGRTTDPDVLRQISQLVRFTTGHVIVIHDADHHYQQVREDLDCYHRFVTPGSYLIVEDTNVNGHPVLPEWGDGPWEAVRDFTLEHPEFESDPSREKFLLTYNPGGYLRRRS